MEIAKFESKEEAAAAAGEALNNFLKNFKDKPVLLLLSGGSALTLLDYVGQKNLGENLTVSVLDERFSQDGQVNNFIQIQQTDFYTDAQTANASFFGTLPRVGETKENLARRWQDNLKKWHEQHPQGKIFATVGMGADGHMAGIFPLPEDQTKFNQLFNAADWVVAYNALGKNQYPERVTTTFTFFKEIDEAIGYICGQEKKSKFEALISKTGQLQTLPALGLYKIKHVQIFTDIN